MDFNGKICVMASELITADENPDGFLSSSNYKQLCSRGHIRVARRACYGTPALVEWDTMPQRYREQYIERFGDPKSKARINSFSSKIKMDTDAYEFFSHYRLPDGRPLPAEKITEYVSNASVLNAVGEELTVRTKFVKTRGGSTKKIWPAITAAVADAQHEWEHKLPANEVRLREKFKSYSDTGYTSLISGKFMNANSRKVTVDIERLIMSLYVMKNKPYSTTVHQLYLQFLGGAFDLADYKTGELMSPEDYSDENGDPIIISESTVANILNDPRNRSIVDRKRNSAFDYNNMHRPHHHRHSPLFSFSKISMDDRDLPRKMPDGKRVKAYYSYDVASGCLIGASYSRKKDTGLFIDCLRDMFRFIHKQGLGMPLEVEVEHHLVNQFKDDMMSAGSLFRFVRWCNPGNSQEKRAEHLNRAKKYGYEKRYQDGIGRWYAKLEANRVKSEKIFDENNDTYKEKTFSFEQLVADDRQTIDAFNNSKHPNQKKYKGMTRMQVMLTTQNPGLSKIDEPLLAMYIGEKRETSITRNQYCRLQNTKYILPSPKVVDRLQPGNYEVDAYWLPSDGGASPNVYLYQNGAYVCEAKHLDTYNEATAEQTDADNAIYTNQAKYVSEFDADMKRGAEKLIKISIIPKDNGEFAALKPEVMGTVATEEMDERAQSFTEFDDMDTTLQWYTEKALEML